MKPVIAVMSADWHGDVNPWGRHPTARGDSLYAVSQMVDLANEHRVPLVGAGDLIDVTDPDSYVVVNMVNTLNQLIRPLLYVQGQHERSDPPWMSLTRYGVNLHQTTYTFDSTDFDPSGSGRVTFGGWDYCSDVAAIADQIPDCDVFVTHQVWHELVRNAQSATGRLVDLPHRITRVFTGDYHEMIVRDVPRPGGPPLTLWSPGSTHCRAVNEPADKYVFLLHSDLTVTPFQLDCRPVRNFVVRSATDLTDLIQKTDRDLFGERPETRPDEIDVPVVAVKVLADVHQAEALLRHRFGGMHLHVTLTSEAGELQETGVARPVTDPSSVVMECLQEMSLLSDVRADAKALLMTADPAAARQVLDDICDRYDNPKG